MGKNVHNESIEKNCPAVKFAFHTFYLPQKFIDEECRINRSYFGHIVMLIFIFYRYPFKRLRQGLKSFHRLSNNGNSINQGKKGKNSSKCNCFWLALM